MFLIKCMVCLQEVKAKATVERGRAKLIFITNGGPEIFIFPTAQEGIKIQCQSCGNEVNGE